MNPLDNYQKLAEWLHDQERTKVPFDKLPMENKKVMYALAVRILRILNLHKKSIEEKNGN